MSTKCHRVAQTRHSLLLSRAPAFILAISLAATLVWIPQSFLFPFPWHRQHQNTPVNVQEILSRCMSLKEVPTPSSSFLAREISDRFEPGTKATVIRNAAIFTGEKGGNVTFYGSLFMDKGIIQHIGTVPEGLLRDNHNIDVVDAKGAWVTPGLVDLHSHLGVMRLPLAQNALDIDSPNGPIVPWLRSIDGFATHDESLQLAIAGGVTSAQILPGSGNGIGGQAFFIKLRKTSEGSPLSMTIEPPQELVGSTVRANNGSSWRYLKQACGESLRRYGTRMDSVWALRSAYREAQKVKISQDVFCSNAEAGLWDVAGGEFPEDSKWEVLVDVLRGRVKVSVHCSEAVDLDAMVRLSNEFKFHISSFHHAFDAWLVPTLLNSTWGGPPGLALFATRSRWKREAFRGSEYAPRVLADSGFPVVMKSDHPILNSRYLLYEAQQAHYFGLSTNLSLAAVTSTPAELAGLSHRIGVLKVGADADVVIWDSHPLQLGATPVKVWIDGIVQIPVRSKNGEPTDVAVGKGKEGDEWREVPDVPNWDAEKDEAIAWDGLPPLQGESRRARVVFTNVKNVKLVNLNNNLQTSFSSNSSGEMATVIVENGNIICAEVTCVDANSFDYQNEDVIDLRGGDIAPGMMTYGSPLGLEEIASEPSTGDGKLFDAFSTDVPAIFNKAGIVRAADALMFGTRDALIAYRSGVTFATTSLVRSFAYRADLGIPVVAGLSVTFRTGASHALESGALVQSIAALHIHISRRHPFSNDGNGGRISISTQMAGLRRLLEGWESIETETGEWFKKAAEGVIPLVIEVENADDMANLIILKAEIEDKIGSNMRMVFSGATEAYIIAKQIADAGIGVILTSSRPSPMTWSQRRVLPGPPLSNDTALVTLLQQGVTVGLGVQDAWAARHARFDIRWAALESNGRIDEQEMHNLAYANLQKLLGVRELELKCGVVDLVAYEGGGAFDLSSKVVAAISPERQKTERF